MANFTVERKGGNWAVERVCLFSQRCNLYAKLAMLSYRRHHLHGILYAKKTLDALPPSKVCSPSHRVNRLFNRAVKLIFIHTLVIVIVDGMKT